MPISYPTTAIAEADLPKGHPHLQHLLITYASETNKVHAVWSSLRESDLAFRPHPKSSSVIEILKHQLLSERRFFHEFLGTPEPAAADVLPSRQSPADYCERLVCLARPRLTFMARQPFDWWFERVPFFDVERERIWVFWRRLLHTAHHRTQLTVYQRLLGQPVLPTYGPTADVTWSGADPTLSLEAGARPNGV